MKIRSVTCGDENFALVARAHLSYVSHKVICWWTQNKVVPTGTAAVDRQASLPHTYFIGLYKCYLSTFVF